MEIWLEVLLSGLVGLIIGAGSTFYFLSKNPKKPPMPYKVFKETFHDSTSKELVVSSLREMYRGEKPYPRWKDVAKVFLSSKKDLLPMQSYALWILAEKYKKQRDVLKMYPDCEKIARYTMRGERFSNVDRGN